MVANVIDGSSGANLKKLEKEKGIVIRFVIGHSATRGGFLDKAIDAEDEEHRDFLRLNHIEAYHHLSTKTRLYFSTAVSMWDAHFYVKVDDDVHLNLGISPLFPLLLLFSYFCIFHSLAVWIRNLIFVFWQVLWWAHWSNTVPNPEFILGAWSLAPYYLKSEYRGNFFILFS